MKSYRTFGLSYVLAHVGEEIADYMKDRKPKKQKDSVEQRRDIYIGERSPYWDDVATHDGHENPLANPDVLPETEIAAPSTPQLLMGEAVEHLQGRQREVYLLTMREGKSLAEAAEILGISKGTAQRYKERAIRFIESYCRQAIAKGRV